MQGLLSLSADGSEVLEVDRVVLRPNGRRVVEMDRDLKLASRYQGGARFRDRTMSSFDRLSSTIDYYFHNSLDNNLDKNQYSPTEKRSSLLWYKT